jgi:hypothetical protein
MLKIFLWKTFINPLYRKVRFTLSLHSIAKHIFMELSTINKIEYLNILMIMKNNYFVIKKWKLHQPTTQIKPMYY